MQKSLIALVFLMLFGGAAQAACPATPSSCGQITVGAITNAGATYDPRSSAFGVCTWNGVADVSSCIQSAITAAVAAGPGATVELPAGVLPLGTFLTNTGPVTIKGQGMGVTILKPTAGNVASVYLYGPSNNITGTVIRDLAFDGGGETSTQTNALTQVFHSQDITFQNVAWQNSGGIGFNGSTSNGIKIVNSRVVKVGNRWKTTHASGDRHQGLSFCCGDLTTWGFNNSVIGSYFEDIGLDAINTASETRMVVSNNIFNLENGQRAVVSVSDYPAAIYGSLGVGWSITGNTIQGAQGQCIDAPGLRKSTVSGNTLRLCGGAGVGLFAGGDGVSFTGSMSTTTLTVTAIASGTFVAGQVIGSIGATAIADGTYITAIGTCGGAPSLPCTATINNSQSVSSEAMLAGTNVRGVTVTGNTAVNNGQWSSSTWKAGFTLGNGIPDTVTISGNTASDDQVSPTQPYGVAFKTSSVGGDWTVHPINVTVTGNTLVGNVTAPLLDVSTAPSKVITQNNGLDDVIPATITAASNTTFPLNPLVKLTGTTAITTITAICWTGRVIEMISASATPFTAGNNISNSVTMTANVPTYMTCDGSAASGNWFLR